MRSSIIFIFFVIIFQNRISAQKSGDSLVTLYFPLNGYQLDSSQVKQLSNLKSLSDTITKIEGYTDSTGSSNYNQRLSALRAKAVLRQLDSLHFIFTGDAAGRGESTNAHADLSKNRKAEITFIRYNPNAIRKYNYPDSVYEVLTIDNIFFIPDKAEIRPASIDAVKELAKALKKYKNSDFEILGHVNYKSRLDSSHLTDLYKLSLMRAKRIFELLTAEGIPPSAMRYRGLGNSLPIIADPKNDEERKMNMRVEVRIRSRLKL